MKAKLTAVGMAFITASCAGVDSPIPKASAAQVDIYKEKAPKPYPLATCLVSGEDLDEMNERVSTVYGAQTFEFCCKPCLVKFNKAPKKYQGKLSAKLVK
jgi:YHS domain-containing protein